MHFVSGAESQIFSKRKACSSLFQMPRCQQIKGVMSDQFSVMSNQMVTSSDRGPSKKISLFTFKPYHKGKSAKQLVIHKAFESPGKEC